MQRREEETGAQKNMKNTELHVCCSYEILLGYVALVGLSNELSSPARTLGSWIQIPFKAWMSVCVYSVCVVLCVGSGLGNGPILRPRSPTDCA
jgi:hypothetical protein